MRIRPLAQQDIAEAYDWYEEQATGLGHEFLRAMDAILARIERTPGAYPKVYRELRRALLRRFPYKVYFRLEGDQPVVLAVVHHRRHPRSWRRRA